MDNEELNISRRSGRMGREGGGWGKEGTILNKGNIARDTKVTHSKIVTPIALVLRTIAKEDSGNGLSREFSPLTGREKDIAQTTKHM